MKKPFSRHEVFARIETLVEEKRLKQLLAPPEKPAAAHPPEKASVTPPAAAKRTVPTLPVTTTIGALEARKHLTDMGLQYFSQAQFIAAIERGDKLAVELFIAGGCVDVTA